MGLRITNPHIEAADAQSIIDIDYMHATVTCWGIGPSGV
jgi:hypothetical protein